MDCKLIVLGGGKVFGLTEDFVWEWFSKRITQTSSKMHQFLLDFASACTVEAKLKNPPETSNSVPIP